MQGEKRTIALHIRGVRRAVAAEPLGAKPLRNSVTPVEPYATALTVSHCPSIPGDLRVDPTVAPSRLHHDNRVWCFARPNAPNASPQHRLNTRASLRSVGGSSSRPRCGYEGNCYRRHLVVCRVWWPSLKSQASRIEVGSECSRKLGPAVGNHLSACSMRLAISAMVGSSSPSRTPRRSASAATASSMR